MRRIITPVILFAVATMLSATSFAKDNARETALKAAETHRFEAQVNADAKTLGNLLDDGLEYSHSNGDLDTKQSFIDALTSGKRDYVSTVPTFASVRIFGDVGVIRGEARITVTSDGKTQDLHIAYTDIWIWKNKRWQMTAWRSARLPDSPAK